MHRILILSLVLTVAFVAVALAADPPVATTTTAKDVSQTQATLTATIDPKDAATTVRFDLGTSTSYGLQTATKEVAAGAGLTTVEIAVQGLTASTTYHFRVVATSEGGTIQGADATFTTDAPPLAPSVSSGSVRNTVNDGTTVTGSVNPRGQATTARFQYGTLTAYGSSTPAVDVGSGTSSVPLAADIRGLKANTRYHYRLIATNATGTTRGSDRTFTTGGQPTASTLTVDANPIVWGRPAALRGRITGARRSGIRIQLQLTPWPFSLPFANYGAPVTTNSTGDFRFTLPPLMMTTRAIVIAGTPGVLSPVVTLRSAARVGINRVRRTGRRLIVSGRMRPATSAARVSLQVRSTSGVWRRVGRRVVPATDGTYSISFRRPRRAFLLRVVGLPHDGGAHVTGISREMPVAARRR